MNLIQVQDNLKSMPDQQLQQVLRTPDPETQLLVMSEVQRRQRMRQGAQAQGPKKSIYEQMLGAPGPAPPKAPPPQGLTGALPQAPGAANPAPMGGPPMGGLQGIPPGMPPAGPPPEMRPPGLAGGGAVGYADGGGVNSDDPTYQKPLYIPEYGTRGVSDSWDRGYWSPDNPPPPVSPYGVAGTPPQLSEPHYGPQQISSSVPGVTPLPKQGPANNAPGWAAGLFPVPGAGFLANMFGGSAPKPAPRLPMGPAGPNDPATPSGMTTYVADVGNAPAAASAAPVPLHPSIQKRIAAHQAPLSPQHVQSLIAGGNGAPNAVATALPESELDKLTREATESLKPRTAPNIPDIGPVPQGDFDAAMARARQMLPESQGDQGLRQKLEALIGQSGPRELTMGEKLIMLGSGMKNSSDLGGGIANVYSGERKEEDAARDRAFKLYDLQQQAAERGDRRQVAVAGLAQGLYQNDAQTQQARWQAQNAINLQRVRMQLDVDEQNAKLPEEKLAIQYQKAQIEKSLKPTMEDIYVSAGKGDPDAMRTIRFISSVQQGPEWARVGLEGAHQKIEEQHYKDEYTRNRHKDLLDQWDLWAKRTDPAKAAGTLPLPGEVRPDTTWGAFVLANPEVVDQFPDVLAAGSMAPSRTAAAPQVRDYTKATRPKVG